MDSYAPSILFIVEFDVETIAARATRLDRPIATTMKGLDTKLRCIMI